jgi:hypothetical protein
MPRFVFTTAMMLAAFVLGGACVFVVLHKQLKPKPPPQDPWIEVTTDGPGVGYETDFIETVPPEVKTDNISSPSGRVRFLDRDNGMRFGYALKLPIKPVPTAGFPKKYLKTTPMRDGFEIIPPDQVHFNGYFQFTLKDADGFLIQTLQGPEEYVVAGSDNFRQNLVEASLPPMLSVRTKKVEVTFTIKDCSPCK